MLLEIREYCRKHESCDICNLKTVNPSGRVVCIFDIPPAGWSDFEIEKVYETVGIKDAYHKGWVDGAKAMSVHKELCEEEEKEFHCMAEEEWPHAYNCNDCPNKCEEFHQWDKEMKGEDGNVD